MDRIEELKILIDKVKWEIKHYANEFKGSSTDKYLAELKEKINQFENYQKELEALNKNK